MGRLHSQNFSTGTLGEKKANVKYCFYLLGVFCCAAPLEEGAHNAPLVTRVMCFTAFVSDCVILVLFLD
jgi:hypothetical protein